MEAWAISLPSKFRFHVKFQGDTLNNQDFWVSEFDEQATGSGCRFYRSVNGWWVGSACCWSNVVYSNSRILKANKKSIMNLHVSLHASKDSVGALLQNIDESISM